MSRARVVYENEPLLNIDGNRNVVQNIINRRMNPNSSDQELLKTIRSHSIEPNDFYVVKREQPQVTFSNHKNKQGGAIPERWLPIYNRYKDLMKPWYYGIRELSDQYNKEDSMYANYNNYEGRNAVITKEEFQREHFKVKDLFMTPILHPNIEFDGTIIDESGKQVPKNLKRLYTQLTSSAPARRSPPREAPAPPGRQRSQAIELSDDDDAPAPQRRSPPRDAPAPPRRSPPRNALVQIPPPEGDDGTPEPDPFPKAMMLVQRHFGDQPAHMQKVIAEFIVENSSNICMFSRLSKTMRRSIHSFLNPQALD
jgi:hypothetical protein